jgi:OOP family OmpA-OmpF porin
MKTRIAFASIAALAAATQVPATAAAAESTFALSRYEPTPLVNDWLRVERPTGLAHMGWGAVVTADYSYKPLVLVRKNVDGSTNVEKDVVSDQAIVTPGLAFGLFNRVTVHGAIPVIVSQGGKGYSLNSTDNLGKPADSALADVRLGARVRLLGKTEPKLGIDAKPDLLSVALGAYVFAPTGDAKAWSSDGTWRAQPTAIVEIAPSRTFFVTMNLGFMLRPNRGVLGSNTGTEGFFSVAGGVKLLHEKLRLGAELTGGTGLRDSTLFKSSSSPAEALASATYQFTNGLYVSLGGGAGLSYAAGTPAARGVLRVGWASPWLEKTKKVESVEKTSGKDSDGDGIIDDMDSCDYEKGPHSADPDSNGCPDKDGDGVADKLDACPSEAGPHTSDPLTNGCPPPPPPPDRDKDGIFDAKDACPDVPGIYSEDPSLNGCPPDKDKDGVLDPEDACPDDPGPKTADPKTNGCPIKTKFAEVKGGTIIILDKVNFANDSDKIVGAKSFQVLDSVWEILDKTPSVKKLRIEGHTDNKGKADHNKDLSKRRALAVKAYLVKKGIVADRLDAEGYGQEKPLDDNKTEAGRAKNRRVEFVIVNP